MAVQRRTIGIGFTRRNSLSLHGTSDDMRDTLHAAAAAATFESQITEAEATANKILTAAGPEIASDTIEAYAQQIRRLIQIVRGAIGRNDAAEAARYALNLGGLIREADLKFEWEKHALRGASVVEGAARGGKGKKGTTLDTDIAASTDFEKRTAAKRAQAVIRVTQNQIVKDMLRDKTTTYCHLSKNGLIAAIGRGNRHRYPARKNKKSIQGGKVD